MSKSNLDTLINSIKEIAYKLIGRDRETGYPLVDLIQIKRDKTILKIRYGFSYRVL